MEMNKEKYIIRKILKFYIPDDKGQILIIPPNIFFNVYQLYSDETITTSQLRNLLFKTIELYGIQISYFK